MFNKGRMTHSEKRKVMPKSGIPPGLENLEKWESIFQWGNLGQTGKVRGFYTKCYESMENYLINKLKILGNENVYRLFIQKYC